MKKLALVLSLLAALGLTGPARAFDGVPTIGPYTARQLAPGVHLLATPPEYRGGVIGNSVVVEQSDGFIVFDSGGTAADGRRAVAFIRSVGAKPVKALIYSHWHGDHPQGVPRSAPPGRGCGSSRRRKPVPRWKARPCATSACGPTSASRPSSSTRRRA